MSALTRNWSLDPSLVYVCLAGVMYLVGGWRRSRTTAGRMVRLHPLEARRERLRVASFWVGLATIVIALDSPIDYYSDLLFWVHMGQHILLLTVAPPLILIGRPWPRMWQALPITWRASAGRTITGSSWTAPIRAVARPVPAWLLFNLNMALWHIPGAYNLTLNHQWIHDCEHALFFFTGLLFWAHIVDPGPLRHRMNWMYRAAYITGAMVAGWILAIVLVLAPHPLYPHYAQLLHRPGGISAIEDQQLAGGMMWVPGSISYTIAVILAFWRWVAPEADAKPRHSPAPAV